MKFIGIILVLFLFAGCSGDSETDSARIQTMDVKELARDTLRSQQPVLTAGQSDEAIDDLAEATCSAWDSGATPEDMVIAAMDDDTMGETGAVMMMSAIGYCPEHKLMLDAFIEMYS